MNPKFIHVQLGNKVFDKSALYGVQKNSLTICFLRLRWGPGIDSGIDRNTCKKLIEITRENIFQGFKNLKESIQKILDAEEEVISRYRVVHSNLHIL